MLELLLANLFELTKTVKNHITEMGKLTFKKKQEEKFLRFSK